MPRILHHIRSSPRVLRGLVLAAVASSAVAATVVAVRLEQRDHREERRERVATAVRVLERELALREAALRGTQGLLAASTHVDAAEFRRFGRLAVGPQTGAEAVWHPLVPRSGRSAFERAAGVPIAAVDAEGARSPRGPAARYLPGKLSSTPGGGRWPLGEDLLSERGRAATALRAIALADLAVSPPLVRSTPSRPTSLLLVLPVYGAAAEPPPAALRDARLTGVVVQWVRVADLEDTVTRALPEGTRVRISGHEGRGTGGPSAWTTVGGQRLDLHVTGDDGSHLGGPAAVAVTGLALLLLTGIVFAQAARREREVTGALARQSRARDAAEATLRLREDRFRVLAQEVPVGICILTADGVLEYANQRSAELMGVSIAGLVGETLIRPAVDPADRDRLQEAVHEALAGRRRLGTAVWMRYAGGARARLRVQAVPTGQGEEHRLLCTLTDVTGEHLAELRERAVAEVAAVVASDAGVEAVLDAAQRARASVPGGDADAALQERLGELVSMARSAAAARQTLTARADRDPLTGLANRRVFWEALTAAVAGAGPAGAAALVLIDIDHFKRVNDTHGHPVGDAVLVEMAERLRRSARGTDLVARVGGEEFAWLMPGADTDGARVAAERLLEWVRARPFPVAGRLTCSAGICAIGPADVADDAYRRADLALYAAKRAGRDAVRVDGPGAAAPAPPGD